MRSVSENFFPPLYDFTKYGFGYNFTQTLLIFINQSKFVYIPPVKQIKMQLNMIEEQKKHNIKTGFETNVHCNEQVK